MSDAVVAEWQDRIRAASASRSALAITGGGTKGFYGNPSEGELLDTRACAGIVDYEPTELVLVARAGTPLAEIEARLAEAGQMLAFEPPHFGPGATIGGVVAAGLSGPRRPWGGAVRDLVLGITLVDGNGTLLRFGGRVMKNVAGFDATRLMVGALGTLGVITEVAVKCLPAPRCDATRAFECGADAAIHMANDWSARGLPLSATCWWRGTLAVRLSGADSRCCKRRGRSAVRRSTTPLRSGTACASRRTASSPRERRAAMRCGGYRWAPRRRTSTSVPSS